MKQLILILFLVGFLAVLQTSVLPHVGWFGINLLLLAAVLVALLEPAASSAGLAAAFAAGFLWDVFSGNILGQGASILVASVLLLKVVKARYVQLPFLHSS